MQQQRMRVYKSSLTVMTDSLIKPSSTNNKIIALILFSFLTTFVAARLIVYAVMNQLIPDLFLYVRGVHIHHFTYGVVILAVAGLYLILKRPEPSQSQFKWLTIAYGVGLGLTFDEFGMWIRLADNYWIRQSYDAMIIVSLILLNIVYYKWIIRGIKEIIRIIVYPIHHPKKSPDTI